MTALRLLGPCLLLLYLVYWSFRRHFAGPLLLDGSTKVPILRWIFFGTAILALLQAFLEGTWNVMGWNALSAVAYSYFFSRRIEFRRLGILTGQGYFAWQKVQAYSWKEGERTGEDVLALTMRARPALFSDNQLTVRADRSEEAQQIVRASVPEA